MKDEAKRALVIQLRKEGMTYKQIAERLGMKNESWVNLVCKENGLGGTAAWKEKRHEAIRAYKAAGHTHKEVAEHFGISEETSIKAAKGIAPQIERPNTGQFKKGHKNQWSDGNIDQTDRVIKVIEERCAGFEYVGNYTGSDGTVDVRCKKCGAVVTKSWVTIRHRKNYLICPTCEDAAKKEKAERKEQERRQKAEEDRRRKEARILSMKSEQTAMEVCPVCFSLFVPVNGNKKYCSKRCATRAQNAHHKDKRMRRIKSLLVDSDITIDGVATRDSNICWLCGDAVDWNDYTEKNGAIVTGDNYPSIDHVVPLAAGGLHAWDNVRLAHRRCNYLKRDSLLPSYREIPENTGGTEAGTFLDRSARETKTGQLMLIC